MKFYNLTPEALRAELDTDFEAGLSSEQAEQRLKKDGQNFRAHYGAKSGRARLYRAAFFALVSVAVYLLAALFKKDLDYVFCAAAMLVICSVSLFVCEALLRIVSGMNSGSSPLGYGSLTVLRDGKETRRGFREITYGDVVLLKKGDYVPFDARVLSSDGLETDETGVTGSRSSVKRPGVIDDENADVSGQYNTVFSSSYVVSGSGRVVVTDISERVYVKRSHKGASRDKKLAASVSDFSRMLSLLLLAVSLVFTLAGAFITSSPVNFAVCAALLASAFLSDYFGAYVAAAFNGACAAMFKRGIYVKSLSDVEQLNACNVQLVRYNDLFDKNAEITGFVLGGEYHLVSEINKSNFSVFLYSCFCNESAPDDAQYHTFKRLTQKLLRGVGVDYEDILSMCPVLSHHRNGTCDVCGIVYDGSNVLIARGDHAEVLRLCGQSREDHAETIEKISQNSTEIIAVAVKQVGVIPDDLSTETDGFSLVGFIGLKRTFSPEKLKRLSALERDGVRSLILFPGNESAAKSLSLGKSTRYCDYSSMDPRACDIAYGFDGDMEKAAKLCVQSGLRPVFRGGKTDGGVAFGDVSSALLETRENEFVSDGSLDSVLYAAETSRSVFASLRELMINGVAFAFALSLCSLIPGAVRFPAPAVALTALLSIPFVSLVTLLLSGPRGTDGTGEFAQAPLRKRVIVIPSVCAVLLALCSLVSAPGFAAVALAAFFPLSALDVSLKGKRNILLICASYIPAVLLAILFATPLGALLGTAGFNALQGVLAILAGASVRYLGALAGKIL